MSLNFEYFANSSPKMMTSFMMSFSLDASETHFQVQFGDFLTPYPEICHAGEIEVIN